MASSTFRIRVTALCLCLLTGLSVATWIMAQPVAGQVIDRVSVAHHTNCSLITVSFNLPMQYLGHFPPESGDLLRIRLHPVVTETDPQAIFSTRESASISHIEGLPLEKVSYEGETPEPNLILQFSHPTVFIVAQGEDFRSILIQILRSGTGAGQTCHPFTDPSQP
jgi:hypothetical protein